MSVARRLLWLSIGIGGLSGLTWLPALYVRYGSGVLLGYLVAIWGVAVPAMYAERSFWQLHQLPLFPALQRARQAGHLRASWGVASGVLSVTTLLLAALALIIATWIILAVLSRLGGATLGPELSAQWRGIVPVLILLAAAVVWTPRSLYWDPQLRRVEPLALLLFAGVCLLGMTLLLTHAPVVELRAIGVLQGLGFGIAASWIGLGVYYTQWDLLRSDSARATPAAAPLLLGLGMSAWPLALMGWGLAMFARVESGGNLAGFGIFLRTLTSASLSTLEAVVAAVLAVAVLCLGARILLAVSARSGRDREYWQRFAFLCGWAALGALALGGGLGDPVQQWALATITFLRGWLVPLCGLLVLSLMVRGVPPAAMLTTLPGPLWRALLIYGYWRYGLRLILVVAFLQASGLGDQIWQFWQTVDP